MDKWTPEDLANKIDNEGLDYMINGYLGPITVEMLEDFPEEFDLEEFVRHWNMAGEGLSYVENAMSEFMP